MTAVALPQWIRIVREPVAYANAFRAPRQVRSPNDVLSLLAPLASVEETEVFWEVLLDSQANVRGLVEVTRGLLNSSLVHPREVFRTAIAYGAASLVLAHNHPSGDPTPSAEDRAVTRQLVAAGKLLDVPVHDHVILAGDRWTSFATAGLL